MARVREIVAGFLASLLLMAPVYGANSEALGTIVAAKGASIDGSGVAVGTTVFGGERLSTEETGSVLLRTNHARLYLAENSIATINEDAGQPTGTLLGGTATFSTSDAKAFALNASKAVIRPKNDDSTIGQVTLIDARHLFVKCTKGALTVTVGDETREVAEGSSYRIVIDPTASEEEQDQPPPQGAGAKGVGRPPLVAGRSRFVWYATAAVVLVTIFAVHEALESADRP